MIQESVLNFVCYFFAIKKFKLKHHQTAAILHGEEAKKHLFKARQRSVNKEGNGFIFNNWKN